MDLAGLDCECLTCHILIKVHLLRVFFSRAGQSSSPTPPAEPWRPNWEKEMGLAPGSLGAQSLHSYHPLTLTPTPLTHVQESVLSVC